MNHTTKNGALRARKENTLTKIERTFDENGYWRRLARMIRGFGCPRASREFKEARIEAQRLAAPLCAVLVPLTAAVLLMILAAGSAVVRDPPLAPIFTDAPEPPPTLDDPPPLLIPQFFGHTDGLEGIPLSELLATATPAVAPATAAPPLVPVPSGTPTERITIKNPPGFKSPYPGRTPGVRDDHVVKTKNQRSEEAVMAALRWLKQNQQANGSWPKNTIAMTGLATLTFLAHGETPGANQLEFGETVRRAIEYLIGAQGSDGRIGASYAHAIAAYALCEAYGMTRNPNVKQAADKAVHVLVTGQNPTGGWDYGLTPSERDDTSVMGWCAQALKAAQLADAYHDRPALQTAIHKAVQGFRKNYKPGGGFGYTGPGAGGLSGVGTLCLQFLGASGSREVRDTLALMDAWRPAFRAEKAAGLSGSVQYYYYYATQAIFHDGGRRWDQWHRQMWPIYVDAQRVEKLAYTDPSGLAQDIGWWENSDAHSDRPVMDTCLAALQLMVYYRNLQTAQAEAVTETAAVRAATAAVDPDDILVDLGNL